MSKRASLVGLALLLSTSVFVITCAESGRTDKSFDEQEIAEIQEALKGLDPAGYRIVLPQLENGRVVGSETYGSLPLTEVRRVASERAITFVDDGNVQAILSNSGAGSHTESQTPGTDIGRRIETILQGLDKSEYVLID
jgi:hypothetical protein